MVMVIGITTIYPHGLNKSSKFCVGSQVQHKTLEEGQRMHRLKYCRYNNEDEDNSPNIISDKNSDRRN